MLQRRRALQLPAACQLRSTCTRAGFLHALSQSHVEFELKEHGKSKALEFMDSFVSSADELAIAVHVVHWHPKNAKQQQRKKKVWTYT